MAGQGKSACIHYDRGRSKVDRQYEMVGTIQNLDWMLTNALGEPPVALAAVVVVAGALPVA
jgi:hypothetical protein